MIFNLKYFCLYLRKLFLKFMKKEWNGVRDFHENLGIHAQKPTMINSKGIESRKVDEPKR